MEFHASMLYWCLKVVHGKSMMLNSNPWQSTRCSLSLSSSLLYWPTSHLNADMVGLAWGLYRRARLCGADNQARLNEGLAQDSQASSAYVCS